MSRRGRPDSGRRTSACLGADVRTCLENPPTAATSAAAFSHSERFSKMRTTARRSGLLQQGLVVLLCSLAAFTPACGPPLDEDLGDLSGSESNHFAEAGESALT